MASINALWPRIQSFGRDESGSSAIEYAIIASLIMLVIVIAVGAIGTSLSSSFEEVNDGFK